MSYLPSLDLCYGSRSRACYPAGTMADDREDLPIERESFELVVESEGALTVATSTKRKTFKLDPTDSLPITVRFGAPDWLPATAYVRGAWVLNAGDGKYYKARFGHTSAATFVADAGKWELQTVPVGSVQTPIDLWLDVGEILASGTPPVWVVPTGLTKDSQAGANYTATIQLSGGTIATGSTSTRYTVAVKVTTDSTPARVLERSLDVLVLQR